MAIAKQKSGFVVEDSNNISTLKTMFEGTAAQEKRFKEQLELAEQELQRNKTVVEAKINQAESQLEELSK